MANRTFPRHRASFPEGRFHIKTLRNEHFHYITPPSPRHLSSPNIACRWQRIKPNHPAHKTSSFSLRVVGPSVVRPSAAQANQHSCLTHNIHKLCTYRQKHCWHLTSPRPLLLLLDAQCAPSHTYTEMMLRSYLQQKQSFHEPMKTWHEQTCHEHMV